MCFHCLTLSLNVLTPYALYIYRPVACVNDEAPAVSLTDLARRPAMRWEGESTKRGVMIDNINMQLLQLPG